MKRDREDEVRMSPLRSRLAFSGRISHPVPTRTEYWDKVCVPRFRVPGTQLQLAVESGCASREFLARETPRTETCPRSWLSPRPEEAKHRTSSAIP